MAMHVGHTLTRLPEDPKGMLTGTKKWRYTIIYLALETENDGDDGFGINPVCSLDD